jgi:trk system potassium uptake protein TrkH
VVTLLRRRRWEPLPLDHKLIFATTGALLVAGTVFLFAWESGNAETLDDADWGDRAVVSFFQSTNARTAGFSAVETGELRDESKLSTIGLMFVGGAAGSTAGGLKVGAFALLFVAMVATVQGREEVTAFRRVVPLMVVRQALTLALLFVALVFGFTMALSLSSDVSFLDTMFESVSALGTVGLSAVGTGNLPAGSHWILIAAMTVGRFAPLMLVLEMTRPRRPGPQYRRAEDSIRLG